MDDRNPDFTSDAPAFLSPAEIDALNIDAAELDDAAALDAVLVAMKADVDGGTR